MKTYDIPQVEPALELLNEVSNALDAAHGQPETLNPEELRGKLRMAIIILKEELDIS